MILQDREDILIASVWFRVGGMHERRIDVISNIHAKLGEIYQCNNQH